MNASYLVALAGESDLLAVVHALVDGDLEDLALARHLLAGAAFAPQLGVDALALALALPAHRLHLLHDAGAKLLEAHLELD